MEDFTQLLKEHTEAEDKKFDALNSQLATMRDNHLAHLTAGIASLTADMAWVKWVILATAGASIVGIVGLIFKS